MLFNNHAIALQIRVTFGILEILNFAHISDESNVWLKEYMGYQCSHTCSPSSPENILQALLHLE